MERKSLVTSGATQVSCFANKMLFFEKPGCLFDAVYLLMSFPQIIGIIVIRPTSRFELFH